MNTTIPYIFYKILPAKLRNNIKRLLSASGHSVGMLDGMKAKKDALGKRRLDWCFSRMCSVADSAFGGNFTDKVCCDFGAGYVISDAVSMYLLGCDEVYSLDYNNIANEKYTKLAFDAACNDDIARLGRARLGGAVFDKRLSNLKIAMIKGSFESLKGLGIIYQAPFDYSQELLNKKIDFLYSVSVLEHIHPLVMASMMKNWARDVVPNGLLYHQVHLEDHLNFQEKPFDFLRLGTDYKLERHYDDRGNRLRPSEWRAIFEQLIGFEVVIEQDPMRGDVVLPQNIVEEYQAWLPQDLFVSNITIIAKKMRL